MTAARHGRTRDAWRGAHVVRSRLDDGGLTASITVAPVVYVLDLPDGRMIRCRHAYQVRRLAELFIILRTGHAPRVAPK